MELVWVCAGLLIYFSIGWAMVRGIHYKMMERQKELETRKRVKEVIYKTQENPDFLFWNCRKKWLEKDRYNYNLRYIESFTEKYNEMYAIHGKKTMFVLYLSVGIFWLPSLMKKILDKL
jgi:hypothetical protein